MGKKTNQNFDIDFVVPWVDNTDPVWLEKKKKYTGTEVKEGNSEVRYRDWDTLKYWFRGVEKFAPWVRYVYFITDDQKPEWLNIDHPKLKWVKHKDYIPLEYLPTFNSNVIEWNLHRIEGLSDNFVYFNDDVFLINSTNPEDFFEDGVPCDYPQIGAINSRGFFLHMIINNYVLINRNLSMKKSIKQNPLPWLRAQKLKFIVNVAMFKASNMLLRVQDQHIQISYNKKYFQKLWDAEYDIIHKTCQNKLRSVEDITSWCVREWQILSNDFHFKKPIGKYFLTADLSNGNGAIEYIKKQKGKTICLNDNEVETDFELHKRMILNEFEKLFPEKSSFEL